MISCLVNIDQLLILDNHDNDRETKKRKLPQSLYID